MTSSRSTRVAVVVSHPIQHFCPQYSSWSRLASVDVKVFFASRHGLVAYEDKGFNRVVRWDDIRLDFPHEFLAGAEGRSLGPGIDCPELEERLAHFAPDAVVLYGYSQPLQRRALRWTAASRVPAIMCGDSELRAARDAVRRGIKALVLPRIFRDVTLFLTVGDANEAYYRRYGVADHRLVRSFFPIDVQHYDRVLAEREERRRRIRQQHGIPDHYTVMLMVGKLVPWKRQSDLVQFSNQVAPVRDDITVVLVGTGPDEDALRGAARRLGPGGVVFAGFIPPSILADYYCAADVYVHCSEREPHSLAISEAVYCGLPIVVSDRCGSYGPTDDVRPGLNGLVFRCGDVDDLSHRLLYVADDHAARRRMSVASATIGRQHQALAHGGGLEQVLSLLRSDTARAGIFAGSGAN
jgi:glycosyltransferase involved in cell wall biosynthesis